jgi:hypothetical protein
VVIACFLSAIRRGGEGSGNGLKFSVDRQPQALEETWYCSTRIRIEDCSYYKAVQPITMLHRRVSLSLEPSHVYFVLSKRGGEMQVSAL